MRIFIPSDDGRGLESNVHGHFGSAPWFTIVDTDSGTAEAVENPACGASPGACHHVGMLSRRGIEAVVCAGMGRRAVSGLADAGIRVLVAPDRRIAEVVEMAKAGDLRAMEFDAACAGGFHHGHGRGAGRGAGHRHGHRGSRAHD
jgi:predicted Fe-Mo cluster-binding NifX family protein